LFLCMGLVLEGLHGFKVAAYLDVGLESRRLMFTLAHSHGALLAVVNLALAGTAHLLSEGPAVQVGSLLLRASTVVLPAGFFLGGVFLSGADPGLGVLLVPLGALMLMGSVGAMAWASFR
jgi:hypothetical protein